MASDDYIERVTIILMSRYDHINAMSRSLRQDDSELRDEDYTLLLSLLRR